MSASMALFLFGGGLGVWVGYYVGRFRAEWGRARADGKAAMERRGAYRSKESR